MESPKELTSQNHWQRKKDGSGDNGAHRWRRLFPSRRRRSVYPMLGFFVEILCQQSPLNLKEFLDRLEKEILLNMLAKVGGNQKMAARALGLKYTTLNEKIKKYNIRFEKVPSIFQRPLV